MVGDVVVCYRCNAHYRGLAGTKPYPPYELTTGERYRQERVRREQFLKSSAPQLRRQGFQRRIGESRPTRQEYKNSFFHGDCVDNGAHPYLTT